jgi:hypothetical protein
MAYKIVHGFPTYFIIDRESNIIDSKLCFPLNFKNAVDELEKVLLKPVEATVLNNFQKK